MPPVSPQEVGEFDRLVHVGQEVEAGRLVTSTGLSYLFLGGNQRSSCFCSFSGSLVHSRKVPVELVIVLVVAGVPS